MVAVVEAGQNQIIQQTEQISAQITYVTSLLEQLVGNQTTTEARVAKIDERTKRLTPAHARAVQGMVERIVKESERRNLHGAAQGYPYVYGRLKTRFRSGKFDEIPDERYDEVEAYLHEELRKVTGGQEPMQDNLF